MAFQNLHPYQHLGVIAARPKSRFGLVREEPEIYDRIHEKLGNVWGIS